MIRRRGGQRNPVSSRRAGRLVPSRAVGLRAGSVFLKPGGVMDWHSTKRREELLIVLTGRIQVEARPRRRMLVSQGQSLLLPTGTWHRILNRSRRRAHYLYVTGAGGR